VPAFAILSIIIHVTNLAGAPPAIVRDAQHLVTDMFREAGVDVRWAPERESLRGHVDAVRVTLLPHETGALQRAHRAVLGAAMPSATGVGTAWVFYDRIAREAARHGVAMTPVLASAIAHEIGHLLQASPGHAEHGLMRSAWNRGDYLRAGNGRLRFSAADVAQFESFATTR
jgi:hypothetical protein